MSGLSCAREWSECVCSRKDSDTESTSVRKESLADTRPPVSGEATQLGSGRPAHSAEAADSQGERRRTGAEDSEENEEDDRAAAAEAERLPAVAAEVCACELCCCCAVMRWMWCAAPSSLRRWTVACRLRMTEAACVRTW